MRNRTLLALGAAASLGSTTLIAQQATTGAPQTHTVKAGETLSGLARDYLKDPDLWPQIYRLNRDKITDPHWIYPGQVLTMPGMVTKVDVVAAPAAAAAPPQASVPTPPVVRSQQAPPTTLDGPTVFAPPVPVARSSNANDAAEVPERTVLLGDYIRAPYVVRADAKIAGGRIVKSADLTVAARSSQIPIFQVYDAIFIQVPAGEVAAEGQQYVTVKMGPRIEGFGQVMIPTGILEITRAPRAGDNAVARMVRIFGEVNPGQMVLPLDTAGVASTERPHQVADGQWAKIRWMLSEPVLPTLQAYIVLDAKATDGIRPGDEFLLFKPHVAGVDGAPGDPEIPIGRARAIKVTPYGTSAMVISEEQPLIQAGGMARTSAKMP